ncbi:arginine--tRNA ligase [Candidatus Parcubacteria bacterium]|nr:arginine--tRNA ligase [Candidatus Parcubacteria bacterium]
MSIINKIKQNIAKEINQAVKADIVESENLVYPSRVDMGDLSLPCFVLANNLGKNPAKIAEFLVKNIKPKGAIAGLSALGPYFNIKLNKAELAKEVVNEIESLRENYGHNKSGRKQKIMIEYSNVNTHKEYHIGHLRNICYGDAVNRVTRANGYKSIPVSYVNDFGIHIAKTIWGLIKFYLDDKISDGINKDLEKFSKYENKGALLGEIYARANKAIKKDKTAKQLVEVIMKKIESRASKEYELWKITRAWSIEQFAKIYEELGIEFEKIYYESEFIEKGQKMVKELLQKNILEKSQGAVIANLEKYDLGVLVVLRSDGTATYPVADIPLAMRKFKEYNPDASIYVVDKRQALYFKQLFHILKAIGYKKPMIHLGYDVVKLPNGMMSSRLGNTITYEDLKEQLFKKAKEETNKRHPDWSKEKIDSTVCALVLGVIKFEMLKINQEQPITFDIGKALSFNGFTSAYLQYTYARIQSIVKKAGIQNNPPEADQQAGKLKVDFNELFEEKEHNLILRLAKYPSAVKQAGKDFNPSEIARYLFELARDMNDYYHEVPILKSDEKTRNARLALILSVSQVIKNGLDLLGIGVVEEM